MSFVVKSKPRNLSTVVESVVMETAKKFIDTVSSISEDEIDVWRSIVTDDIFGEDQLGLQTTIESLVGTKPLVKMDFSSVETEIRNTLGAEYANVDLQGYIHTLETTTAKSLNSFLGKTIAFLTAEAVFADS